jgi:ABC-type Fe3+/spermidine/putrescine transport system ATPase subunit
MTTNRASDVSLEEVTHSYATTVTLSGVTLHVRPGEFLTVIGPSGSGKTTLLRIVGGLTEPTSGRVVIGERDVTRVPARSRNVGFVFQNYALFPHLTVFDNVAYPLALRHFRKPDVARRVQSALALVQLSGLENRYPSQLSGGQQQRVALARATVFEPAVLLLDEPLGALDRRLRQQLGMDLRRIQRETGLTTLYVTHDQEEAFVMSDRIAVIHQGAIRQLGPPDQVYDHPADLFVAEFLGEINSFRGHVVGGRGDRVIVQVEQGLQIESESAASVRPGQEVTCLVRPEKVKVGNHSALPNQFTAAAQTVVFHGSMRRVLFRCLDTIVTCEASADVLNIREGDVVKIGWQASDVVIFPREPA